MSGFDIDSDGIGLVTVNRPDKLNSFTRTMHEELSKALDQVEGSDARALIITGAGRGFCAGADIQMLANVTPTFKYYFCLHANEMLLRLEHTPKLVLAAINGHTSGHFVYRNVTTVQ